MEVFVALVIVGALIWLVRKMVASDPTESKAHTTSQQPSDARASIMDGDAVRPEYRNEGHVLLTVEDNARKYAERNITKFINGDYEGLNAGDVTAVRIALHLSKGDPSGAKKIFTGSAVGHFIKTGKVGIGLTPENYPEFTHWESMEKYLIPYHEKKK